MSTQRYPEVKCPKCGWVHVAIPAQVARESGDDFERYLRCFRCGADSAGFVPAGEADAPLGATLQACVVERDG